MKELPSALMMMKSLLSVDDNPPMNGNMAPCSNFRATSDLVSTMIAPYVGLELYDGSELDGSESDEDSDCDDCDVELPDSDPCDVPDFIVTDSTVLSLDVWGPTDHCMSGMLEPCLTGVTQGSTVLSLLLSS